MGQIIQTAGRTFLSKASYTTFIRTLLHGSPIGVPFRGRDERLLVDLLESHPSYPQKAGAGIYSVFVAPPPGFPGQRCFWLRRTDGTTTDWSYKECLNPSPHQAKVKAAFRSAIADQTIMFGIACRTESGLMTCAITGETFEASKGHVDHIPSDTFAALVARFMVERKLTYPDIALQLPGDIQTVDRFMSPGLEADWKIYHRRNAKLRLISAKANLGLGFK